VKRESQIRCKSHHELSGIDEKEATEFLNAHGIALEESQDPEALIVLSGGSEEIAKDFLKPGVILIPSGLPMV